MNFCNNVVWYIFQPWIKDTWTSSFLLELSWNFVSAPWGSNVNLTCKGSSILVSFCSCYSGSHLRSVWRCKQCRCQSGACGAAAPKWGRCGLAAPLLPWHAATSMGSGVSARIISCNFCDKHCFQDKAVVQGALIVASLKHHTEWWIQQ